MFISARPYQKEEIRRDLVTALHLRPSVFRLRPQPRSRALRVSRNRGARASVVSAVVLVVPAPVVQVRVMEYLAMAALTSVLASSGSGPP